MSDPTPDTPEPRATPHGVADDAVDHEMRAITEWLVTVMAPALQTGSRLQRRVLKVAALLGRGCGGSFRDNSETEMELAKLALVRVCALQGKLDLTDRRIAEIGEARLQIEMFLAGYNDTVVFR